MVQEPVFLAKPDLLRTLTIGQSATRFHPKRRTVLVVLMGVSAQAHSVRLAHPLAVLAMALRPTTVHFVLRGHTCLMVIVSPLIAMAFVKGQMA